jgi:N-acetylmuramoyl-L-alanine amidase
MADKQNADIFVSLHFNSAPNTAIHGSEVFYYHTSKATIKTKDSKRLATSILKRLCETLPAQSRGVKHGNLCVVRETKMPAVLVESAFLSSPYDLKRLSTLAFRQKIAWAIAKGIDDYYCMR